MELKNNFKIVQTGSIQYNDWNAKKENDVLMYKLVNYIKRYGLMKNLVTRKASGKNEIVDGRFTLKALKILEVPFVMINDLGEISTEEAILHYINLNELKFEFEGIPLVERFNIIQEHFKNKDLEKIMPYTEPQLENIKQLFEFDWSIYDDKNAAKIQIGMFD